MRITRLEIFGFKSFVDRFVLNFDKDLIGIVGPNGCGKSNIVDALRWVLGETHAKQLRGNLQDDLIFNGSESRRPLGMAEVSITIRPSENWRPATITPVLELVDEKALDRLSTVDHQGPAANGESFAEGQGTEQSTGTESTENGVLAELQAKALAEIAELDKETATPALLTSIPGIFDAAEIQLTRRLYRSGESEYFINRVPCRLRDMTDLYRLIGLGSRGLSIVQQGQISELITKKPLERRELLEEAAGISGFRARIEAAERELTRTSENMARLSDIMIEVEKQVKVLERQARRARQRGELKESIREGEIALFEAKAQELYARKRTDSVRKDAISGQLEALQAKLSFSKAREEEQRAELEEREIALADLRRAREDVASRLNEERERENEAKVELARLEMRERTIHQSLLSNDERRTRMGRETEELKAAIQRAGEALHAVEARKAQAEELLKEIQERSSGLSAASAGEAEGELQELNAQLERLPELSREIAALENDVHSTRRALQSLADRTQDRRVKEAKVESSLSSLRAQLEAFNDHAKSAFSAGNAPAEAFEDANVLLAGLRAPADLQRALQAILGERATYLVAPDPAGLLESYGHKAAEREATKKKGKLIGIIDRNPVCGAKRPLLPEELEAAPSAKLLIDQLEVTDGFYQPLLALIGDVVTVNELNEAISLNAKAKELGLEARTIVTNFGEVVAPWGWYTTDGEGLAFDFTRQIAERETELARLSEERAGLEAELEAARAQLGDKEIRAAALRSEKESLLEVQRKVSALLKAEQERERRRRNDALEEERRAQAEVRKVHAELSNAENALTYDQKRLNSLESEVVELARRDERLKDELSQIGEQIQAVRDRVNALAADGDHHGTLERLKGEYDGFTAEIRELEERRSAVRAALGEAAQHSAELGRKSDELNQELNKEVLNVERAGLELSLLHDDIRRIYGEEIALPAEDLSESLSAEEVHQRIRDLDEETQRLRRRLEREGEVDPASIEQFEIESQRLKEMRTQHADLEAAAKILEKTLRQLKEISRIRFLNTFHAVRTKFSELVPRLFGGGSGVMELINPEDPLNSGVEITLRPPGKRLRGMELLSGGEKALAAAALLVSMFLHRPSPVCVLDEVDAPLDDANLDRFLELVREIAQTTQFLIITHNKQTMSAVGKLIGITMQESGVSTALSVSLEEAEAEVERWAALN